MDVRECMLTRRSVRKYKDTPLPDELLTRILEPALTAPSGVNFQHWYFVVLRSPEAMAQFKEILYDVMVATTPELKARFAQHPEVVEQTQNFLVTLGGAPVCVLAFKQKENYPNNAAALQSVAAAIENLLLAAWNEGVATCWMSPTIPDDARAIIRSRFAPGKGDFVAAVCMGYPDQSPQMPPRREGRYTFL